MRLWHLAVFNSCAGHRAGHRSGTVGRIALIIFFTAQGEVVLGTTAVLALFQTIGAIGMARGLFEHGQAVAATTLVLIIARWGMDRERYSKRRGVNAGQVSCHGGPDKHAPCQWSSKAMRARLKTGPK